MSIWAAIFAAWGLWQDPRAFEQEMQRAIAESDLDLAVSHAERAYKLWAAEKSWAEAGRLAFAAGRIGAANGQQNEAAGWFGACADAYETAGDAVSAAACLFARAEALAAVPSPGSALSAYEKLLAFLDRNALAGSLQAGTTHLRIASLLNGQLDLLDTDRRADGKRRAVRSHSAAAAEILRTTNNAGSLLYLGALSLEGEMALQLGDTDEAVAILSTAIEAADKMESSEELVRTRQHLGTQLRVASAETKSDEKDSLRTSRAMTKDGREVELYAQKYRRLTLPRSRQGIAEKSSARIEVTLAADGSVAQTRVLESLPEPEIGDAFAARIEDWIFVAEDGTSASDILPFEMSIVFYLTPRR